jgi:murein tripeptide amidase MpaA
MEAASEKVYVTVSGSSSAVSAWLSKLKVTAELHGAHLDSKDVLTVGALVPKGLEESARGEGLNVLRVEPRRERSVLALQGFVPQGDRFESGEPPPSLGAGQLQGGYLPYYNDAEYQSAMRNLAQTYGAHTQLLELNELTWQNRTVRALRLSLDPGAGNPAIVMLGCMHADEWGGCEILLHLASDLLYSVEHDAALRYGSHEVKAAEVRQLLEERDLILVPVVNPDGRHASQTDYRRPDTRRNARPRHGDRSEEAFAEAVDLNRNFDFLFSAAEFDSTVAPTDLDDITSENHHGPDAASEPETRNIKGLLDDFPQAAWLVDLHRPGLTIRHPWAVDESQDGNSAMNFQDPCFRGKRGKKGDAYSEFLCAQDRSAFEQLATRFRADIVRAGGPCFSAGSCYAGAPMPGSCLDYAYARHLVDGQCGKVLSFLVEWDDTYNQPDPQRMTKVLGYVAAGLIGFSLQTLP